jgi:hypothetical protein
MKLVEFLFEKIIGILHHDDIDVQVSDHAIDRTVDRNVLPTDVDRVLKKISLVKNEIVDIPVGQQFWVYDNYYEVGLGFRKLGPRSNKMRLDLNTIIGNHPRGDLNPIIILPY